VSRLPAKLFRIAHMTPNEKPALRWGIVATGLISSWFVADLIIEREDAKAKHTIQAISSSSLQKGKAFVAQHLPGVSPAPSIYEGYDKIYRDSNVDIVYIGTPHAFHKKNCLDAISHGKNILCEKTFTLNAAETKEVFDAAKAKGVFIMEAMWTRFFPIVKTIQKLVHEDKAIGHVHRVMCDFAMDQGLDSKGPESRLKNLALGASSLLDIGIYSLTWGIIGPNILWKAPAKRHKKNLSC
jgi:predicted dehydrogenase